MTTMLANMTATTTWTTTMIETIEITTTMTTKIIKAVSSFCDLNNMTLRVNSEREA